MNFTTLLGKHAFAAENVTLNWSMPLSLAVQILGPIDRWLRVLAYFTHLYRLVVHACRDLIGAEMTVPSYHLAAMC